MQQQAILVSGGAGYVGGFSVRALHERGDQVAILDDLSAGHEWAVPDGVPLFKVDLRDREATNAALASGHPGGASFDTVLHFAANAYVGESVVNPRKYWENNVGGTLNLLGAALDAGVGGIVFSSTCAVYGDPPESGYLTEDLPFNPVNPYGRTKVVIEQTLADYADAHGLRSFRLRYFNAAGADSRGELGEDHDPESHLIPLAIQAAQGLRGLKIFGTDWDTPDGTCLRDYVHVEDLAAAHVSAVDALRSGHPGGALNLGTGVGTSVREVIASVERVTGLSVPAEAAPRRAGDPSVLIARPGAAREVLGWTPQFTSIDAIVETAWEWHRKRGG